MESRPQNSEFRNNPENFHQCRFKSKTRTVGLRQRAQPNAKQRKDIRFGEDLDHHSSDI